MKKSGLLKNAALLTLTGLILRALGMLLRIYISARIGEEGMGVYQLISSVYFLFITVAQSGIAAAVTRYTAKYLALHDELSAHSVLKSGVILAVCTGMTAFLMMLGLAGMISRLWIADMRALPALYVLSLSLPFIAVCSVLSAFFVATKKVVYGCVSQLIEQLVRMAIVISAAAYFAKYGLNTMLAVLFAANTASEAVSCLYLVFRYRTGAGVPYSAKKRSGHCRILARYAMPVALSRYLASALHTAENVLVPSALAMYTGSRQSALAQFGALKGMALPLLFFPSSFLGALSTLLVPETAAAHARDDRAKMQSIVRRVCSFTLTLSIIASGAFVLFANDLGRLIYSSDNVSFMLLVLAPILPFMYVDSICDGLLKGLGMQKTVLFHNCIDSGVRILLISVLAPKFGIVGFLAVMILSNVLISVLNLRLLLSKTNVKFDVVYWVILPLLCVFVSAIITKFLHPFGATVPKTVLDCSLYCLISLILTLCAVKTKK